MPHLITAKPNKPNRLNVKKEYGGKTKNESEKYHLDYAKWAITNSHTTFRTKWLARTNVNKNFYKGNQWLDREDTEAFLKDTTGQVKNRIQIIHNLIRPMVEQYRGNSIILKINAAAKSVSNKAVNRREKALERQLFKTRVANEFEGIGQIQRNNDPSIGQNVSETTQIFNNLYVDTYVRDINSLLRYVSNLNEFDEMKPRLAQNLALSGLAVTRAYEHGGDQRYEVIESENFFWDTNARKYDLSDSMYQGEFKSRDPSFIFERWQRLKDEQRKAIETYVSTTGSHTDVTSGHSHDSYGHHTQVSNTRVPTYRVFWKDIEKYTYGWVNDEYGYPYLVRINHKEPGEEQPKWTEEDLIDPPNSTRNRRLFKGGKKTRDMYVDILRFCEFIPGELIAANIKDPAKKKEANVDIALDWGIAPYQETDYLDVASVKFPFKAYCWGYVDGEVFSPVDDAINPQRFVNRVLSVAESQINNSGGANIIVDEDATTTQDGAEGVYNDVMQGKPVSVRTKGRGVPNAVGSYDATPRAGTYKLFEIVPIMKNFVQDSTGVNEALKGESIGQDQLVGVTQSLIQRGSLMQEPFYHAIARVFVQMHQHTATVGKRMYIENERELAIAVGDDGVETLKLAKDMKHEDFRVFVHRENSDEALQQQANQMLMVFKDFGFIDDVTFGDHFNRSTPHEVTMAMRQSLGVRAESQRRAAQEAEAQVQQQAAQEQQLAGQIQQQQAVQQGLDRRNQIEDRQHDIDKIFAKGLVDVSKERAKPAA